METLVNPSKTAPYHPLVKVNIRIEFKLILSVCSAPIYAATLYVEVSV